jgi:nicotinamide mononucleotide transporter
LEILPSDLLYWDAFTTAASIIATWMLARKIIEQWLVWILVDMISMGLYLYKGLYLTAGLFLIYTVLAFVGYWQWKKELK